MGTAGASYELRGICMHPVQVYAKEEPKNVRQEAEFVEGKILTRFTSSLDEVFGDLTVTETGLQFQEKGGIDFQAITIKKESKYRRKAKEDLKKKKKKRETQKKWNNKQ